MKNLLILGAVSDIAQAMAHQFAQNGFNIILAARKSERLQPLKSDLEIRHKVQVEVAEFDAHQYNTHQAFFDGLQLKPDVTACVFGILGDHDLAKKDFTEAEKIISGNYTGAVSILNIVANDVESRKTSGIIGISSVAGDRGRSDNYYYGSAKAAFTEYLSGLRGRLLKSNAHVLTVKPGFVDTQMTKDLDLSGPLVANPQKVAKDIYKAWNKGKNVIYSLWMWRYIMLVIRHIPEFIFKKMDFDRGKSAEK